MKEGWIKIHRCIQDNFLWNDKPFARGQAWIDLLMLANHDTHKSMFKGKLVTYEQGKVYTSLPDLANRWGWSRNKVIKFLTLLEDEKNIEKKGTAEGTTLTIVNWASYQLEGIAESTTQGTTEGTTESTTEGTLSRMNKNDENYKNYKDNTPYIPQEEKAGYGINNNVFLTNAQYCNLNKEFGERFLIALDEASEYLYRKGDKYKDHNRFLRKWISNMKTDSSFANVTYSEAFENVWSIYPKQTMKYAAYKAWQELNPDAALINEIINSIVLLKGTRDWFKDNGQYIPKLEKFLRERLWEDNPMSHNKTKLTGSDVDKVLVKEIELGILEEGGDLFEVYNRRMQGCDQGSQFIDNNLSGLCITDEGWGTQEADT